MASTIKYLYDLDMFVFGYIMEDTEKVINELKKIEGLGTK